MPSPDAIVPWVPVLTSLISGVGFPIIMCFYLLMRLDPQIEKLVTTINDVAAKLATLIENDARIAATESENNTLLKTIVSQNDRILAAVIHGQPGQN